uniref:Uncharacterized protein n=1 Tax=Oryza barthii TaxID=65489 RepID=A0A0D3F679_9ORYZ
MPSRCDRSARPLSSESPEGSLPRPLQPLSLVGSSSRQPSPAGPPMLLVGSPPARRHGRCRRLSSAAAVAGAASAVFILLGARVFVLPHTSVVVSCVAALRRPAVVASRAADLAPVADAAGRAANATRRAPAAAVAAVAFFDELDALAAGEEVPAVFWPPRSPPKLPSLASIPTANTERSSSAAQRPSMVDGPVMGEGAPTSPSPTSVSASAAGDEAPAMAAAIGHESGPTVERGLRG